MTVRKIVFEPVQYGLLIKLSTLTNNKLFKNKETVVPRCPQLTILPLSKSLRVQISPSEESGDTIRTIVYDRWTVHCFPSSVRGRKEEVVGPYNGLFCVSVVVGSSSGRRHSTSQFLTRLYSINVSPRRPRGRSRDTGVDRGIRPYVRRCDFYPVTEGSKP